VQRPDIPLGTYTIDGDVLSFDQNAWLSKSHRTCLLSGLGVLVLGGLVIAGVLIYPMAIAILVVLGSIDLVITELRRPYHRDVTLDRKKRLYMDQIRSRAGVRTKEKTFDEVRCIQFHIDHDKDCIEYKVKLGRPTIYKVCEFRDDEQAARALATTISEFTGLPIEERVEDEGKHR